MDLLNRRAGELAIKDAFTYASLGFGLMAIYFAAQGNSFAPWFVLFSVIADFLDGKVARLTKQYNDFGLQLDSLADGAAFGVTPAVLCIVACNALSDSIAIAASIFYAICIITRLAWFNLQDPKAEKGVYYGMPSPLAALGAVATVYLAGLTATVASASLFAWGFLAVSGFKTSKASLKKMFGPLGFIFA